MTESSRKGGAASRLRAAVETRGATAYVAFQGELDLATVGIAEETLAGLDGEADKLVLDLRGVSFLDSSGLRMILSAAEGQQPGMPADVYVVRGPSQVNRVFELTGAAERLQVIDDPSSVA